MADIVQSVKIEGVELFLSPPIGKAQEWIGQGGALKELLACWLVLDDEDLPLCPRLVGPPGIGKTTLGMAAAHTRQQPLYIYQCTRYAPRGPAGHSSTCRIGPHRLSRFAAGFGHDSGWNLHPGRGQPDE